MCSSDLHFSFSCHVSEADRSQDAKVVAAVDKGAMIACEGALRKGLWISTGLLRQKTAIKGDLDKILEKIENF